MGWMILFLVLTALVLVLSAALINWKIQIYRVIVQLQAILDGKTKKPVPIALSDKLLEHMAEMINRIAPEDNIRYTMKKLSYAL